MSLKLVIEDIYVDQSKIIADLLEMGFFPVDEIKNYNNDMKDIKDYTWFAVHPELAEKLMDKGQPVIRSKYGNWWCVKDYRDSLISLGHPVLHEIAGEMAA